jgi:serine/threonine protein kinase
MSGEQPGLPPLDDTVAARPPRSSVLADRYELGELLGRGGFGAVYAATDRLSGQRVAVKLMREMRGPNLGRVRREIAALRFLRLPGVVQLLDDGLDDGRLYLVMQHVEGGPFPGRGPRTHWEDVEETVRALLETLGLVHDSGIVHRDLKPANVLVDERGRPTLLDFGLAKGERVGPDLTAAGALVGTPAYRSRWTRPAGGGTTCWTRGARTVGSVCFRGRARTSRGTAPSTPA